MKITKPILFAILLLSGITILIPTLAFAEAVGSFSSVEGRVDILKAKALVAVPVNTGDSVSMGDIVRTKSDGKAEIAFKDETVLRLAPETRMKIDEYTLNPDKSRNKGILSLLRGKVRAVVKRAKEGIIPVAATGASTFSIQTPTTVAGVRGTDLFVFYEKGITGVIFREGYGFVYNINIPARLVNMSAGQATFVLRHDTVPLPPRLATGIELAVHTKDTTPAKEKRGDETYIKAFRGGVKKEAKAEELGNYQGDEPVTLTYSPLSEGSPRDKASAQHLVQGDMYSSATTITIPPTSLIPITETHRETLPKTTKTTVNVNFP